MPRRKREEDTFEPVFWFSGTVAHVETVKTYEFTGKDVNGIRYKALFRRYNDDTDLELISLEVNGVEQVDGSIYSADEIKNPKLRRAVKEIFLMVRQKVLKEWASE